MADDAFTLDKLREAMAKLPLGPAHLTIIENDHLVDGPFEDWSQVRSPGRAARRRKQGHPQRIRYYYKPRPEAVKLPDGTLVMHPDIARALRERIERESFKCRTS